MSWELCTSGAAIKAAGINANSAIVIDAAALASFSNEAQGELMVETGRDYVGAVTTMQAGTSGAVFSNVACRVANKIVRYDITGYLSRESDTILNYNDNVIINTTNDLKKLNTLQPPKS